MRDDINDESCRASSALIGFFEVIVKIHGDFDISLSASFCPAGLLDRASITFSDPGICLICKLKS